MGLPLVLIVDDDPLFVRLAAHAFKGLYEVETAGSGEEALLSVNKRCPDLITMDHHMPGWDGLETMRRLQQDPKLAAIPVIMCTSDTSTTLLAEAISLGAKGFITKERFTSQEFREIVADVLASGKVSGTVASSG